jgi:hypothetical protein
MEKVTGSGKDSQQSCNLWGMFLSVYCDVRPSVARVICSPNDTTRDTNKQCPDKNHVSNIHQYINIQGQIIKKKSEAGW